MNVKDLLDFVKSHNLPLDTEIGFICENQFGTGFKFTILTNNLTGDKTICLDEEW